MQKLKYYIYYKFLGKYYRRKSSRLSTDFIPIPDPFIEERNVISLYKACIRYE